MNFNDGTGTSQHNGDCIDEDENKYTKVYIGGLRHDIGNDQLQTEFEKFGEVDKAWIARSPHSRGYAFVDFVDPASAAKAIKEMNGKEIFGCKVLVQISRPSSRKKRQITEFQASLPSYTNDKVDNDPFIGSDKTRGWRRSEDRSPRRRSRSHDREYRDRSPILNREPYRHSRNRESTRRLKHSSDSSRRRRSRSRDRYLKSYSRSPTRSPVYLSENESNEPFYQRGRDNGKDDETIARITEAVVRETVPKIYSMLISEFLLPDHLKQLHSNVNSLPGYFPNSLQYNDNQRDLQTGKLRFEKNTSPFSSGNGVQPNPSATCVKSSSYLDKTGNSFRNYEFPMTMCNNSLLPQPAIYMPRIPCVLPPINTSPQMNGGVPFPEKVSPLTMQCPPSSTNYGQPVVGRTAVYQQMPPVRYPIHSNGNVNVSSSPRLNKDLSSQIKR